VVDTTVQPKAIAHPTDARLCHRALEKLKLACRRLPDSGRDLCSQPTVSRWENAPSLRDLIRLMGVMVDLYCASYTTPPATVTLDIDDTVDVVHGHQQLSLFNTHYG
jgi:hypothetical protein